MEKHPIVFCYDKNEYVPVLCGFGHGLKLKNLVICESESIKHNSNKIINKKGSFNNEEFIIIINFKLNSDNYYVFENGTIKINKKEFNIKKYVQFSSLQIENWCYDNIGVLEL